MNGVYGISHLYVNPQPRDAVVGTFLSFTKALLEALIGSGGVPVGAGVMKETIKIILEAEWQNLR